MVTWLTWMVSTASRTWAVSRGIRENLPGLEVDHCCAGGSVGPMLLHNHVVCRRREVSGLGGFLRSDAVAIGSGGD